MPSTAPFSIDSSPAIKAFAAWIVRSPMARGRLLQMTTIASKAP